MKLIPLLLVAIVIGSIAYGIYAIRRRARMLSRQLFQTDSLVEGWQKNQRELAETPKSVAGMTRIYLPQIARDFPEFHYEEFKTRGEHMLKSAFGAIETENPDAVVHGSKELVEGIRLTIQNNRNQNRREHYRDVTIHQTEIAHYQKTGGTCTITLQSAVGHLHWWERDGTVMEGSDTLKEQCKYNIDIVYIQDTTALAGSEQTAFASAVCPNCGAPVDSVGHKVCAFCGSGIQTVNIRTWKIDTFRAV